MASAQQNEIDDATAAAAEGSGGAQHHQDIEAAAAAGAADGGGAGGGGGGGSAAVWACTQCGLELPLELAPKGSCCALCKPGTWTGQGVQGAASKPSAEAQQELCSQQ